MADNFNISDIPESAGPKSVEVPGDIADGTAGDIMSWDALGVASLITVGAAGEVFTANGAGAEASWQAGGGGAVTSVFTRIGAVVAVAGDYAASIVTNDSGVAGAFVDDALDNLAAAIPPVAPVDSVFTRTGAVVAAASDYDASQVDNDSGVAGAFVSDALDTLNTGGMVLRAIFAAGQWGHVATKTDTAKPKGLGTLDAIENAEATVGLTVDSTGAFLTAGTSTTINTEAYWRTKLALIQLNMQPLFRWKFVLDDNADVRFFCGYHEAQATSPVAADDIGDPAVGVLFSTSRPDTNFQFVAHDGTTQTLVDSGIAVDTAPHFVEVDSNAAGTSVIVRLLDQAFAQEATTTFTTELPAATVELNAQQWLRTLAAAAKDHSLYYGTMVARDA